MNRYNFGNVITNSQQILSVGATTASRVLGRADKTLNAKSTQPEFTEQEQAEIKQYRHDEMMERVNKFYDRDNSDIEKGLEDISLKNNSEQVSEIKTKVNNDVSFFEDWFERNLSKKNVTTAQSKQEFIEKLKELKGEK